jgi:hypothetical protein
MTIRNVYGIDTPKIPAGWVATGEFRPPKAGEAFLAIDIGNPAIEALYDWPEPTRRLILAKAPALPGPYTPPAITVEAVYQTPTPAIPNGFKVVGFRPPKIGEIHLPVTQPGEATTIVNFNVSAPRLILERTAPKEYRFVETGEVRLPRKGEWYINLEGNLLCATFNHTGTDRPILRRL